jgi:predicted MFS family arabinose efflux permease
MLGRNRSLAALLVAEVVSSTGTAMTFVALPWFVLVTSGSATRMSVVLAVEVLPMALLGIPSGSVVARLGSRTAMLVSDAIRAPLMLLVPVLHWAAALTFPVLLVIVFVLGVFITPYISAQRTIIPELFGDDETTVAKASGLFGAATQLPNVVGPAFAGILIAALGAPSVLLVDGATFAFAFAVVLVFVRAGRPIPADDESRGILAGVRYLTRDRLLGPMTLTLVVLDGAANAISVAVPLLAFTRYHRDPHIAGWIFTGFGVGAIAGSVLVVKLLDRFAPLRLASIGVVFVTLPLWVIVADVPWPVVCGALFVCGFFVPSVNAPFMGILTTRPPAALRAKVMAAVLTASGLGAPLGRLAIGPVFQRYGNSGTWVALAGGLSLGALLFVAAALRGAGGAAPDLGLAVAGDAEL